ncbi:MAG: hypothetical protein QXF69_08805 [Thermofilaceae archaeon]
MDESHPLGVAWKHPWSCGYAWGSLSQPGAGFEAVNAPTGFDGILRCTGLQGLRSTTASAVYAALKVREGQPREAGTLVDYQSLRAEAQTNKNPPGNSTPETVSTTLSKPSTAICKALTTSPPLYESRAQLKHGRELKWFINLFSNKTAV